MTLKREKKGEYSNSARYIITGLFLLLLTMVSTGILLPGSARAEEEGYGPGTDKWKFELGAFFPAIKTEMTVGAGDTTIDLENVLDLDDNQTIWRLDGYWRFAKKHRLYFGYYGLNRNARKALTDEIIIGGEPWYAGALVDSDLTMDFYQLGYLYSFYQGEKWEISGLLGAYWVRVETTIALAAGIDQPPTGDFPGPGDILVGDRFQSDTFEGPLPLLGLSFDYYITPKWMATFTGGYFQLTINEYKGRIHNLGAKLEYQFTKRFGLGLGYDSFRLKVEADGGDGFAEIDYKYHGVQLYGTLRF
jgi:hypothetical protein